MNGFHPNHILNQIRIKCILCAYKNNTKLLNQIRNNSLASSLWLHERSILLLVILEIPNIISTSSHHHSNQNINSSPKVIPSHHSIDRLRVKYILGVIEVHRKICHCHDEHEPQMSLWEMHSIQDRLNPDKHWTNKMKKDLKNKIIPGHASFQQNREQKGKEEWADKELHSCPKLSNNIDKLPSFLSMV